MTDNPATNNDEYEPLSLARLDEIRALVGTSEDKAAAAALEELLDENSTFRFEITRLFGAIAMCDQALDLLKLVAREAEDKKLERLLLRVLRHVGLLDSDEGLYPDA